MEDFKDIKSGYKIVFTFRDNPYFKNQKLVKELHYADDNALAVQGTDIEWTEEGVCILRFAATHLRTYLLMSSRFCYAHDSGCACLTGKSGIMRTYQLRNVRVWLQTLHNYAGAPAGVPTSMQLPLLTFLQHAQAKTQRPATLHVAADAASRASTGRADKWEEAQSRGKHITLRLVLGQWRNPWWQ